jgi:hypothetical protein
MRDQRPAADRLLARCLSAVPTMPHPLPRSTLRIRTNAIVDSPLTRTYVRVTVRMSDRTLAEDIALQAQRPVSGLRGVDASCTHVVRHHSDLGQWEMVSREPDPRLRAHVRSYECVVGD